MGGIGLLRRKIDEHLVTMVLNGAIKAERDKPKPIKSVKDPRPANTYRALRGGQRYGKAIRIINWPVLSKGKKYPYGSLRQGYPAP